MAKYIESELLELKEKYTDSISREIVSFLNTNGGTILIGIKDNGTVIGVQKLDETLRKISDIITTQIEPNPQDEITSEIKFDKGKTIIAINIKKGTKNIYCQKKYGFSSRGCSIRIGTTCKEMTLEQIKIRYEKNFIENDLILQKKSSLLDLSFRELKIYYNEKGYHINNNSFEANLSLKTSDGSYNLLAELLADYNNIPFIFVKFLGKDKSCISEINNYGYSCILTTYNKIKTRLQSENICISDTTTRPRKDTYLFDYNCVNEALINALVHNDWTITEPQVSIFSNRIEILSHGGLPKGISKKQFFEGISKPRNTVLMRVFLNIGIAEHTGHGIPTIIKKYGKNCFEINDNYIKCTIPFEKKVLEKNKKNEINVNINNNLNKTEKKVIDYLMYNSKYTANELSNELCLSERTIERTIKSLKDKNYIKRLGSNRNGSWIIIR